MEPAFGLLSHGVKAVAYALFTVWRWVAFRLCVEGRQHLPHHGPYIIVANHRSNLDPFLIGYVLYPRGLFFMAKHTLFRNRIQGFVLRQMGAFPVVRHRPDVGAVRWAHACLRRGWGLVLFPEGTRRPGQRTIQTLKSGAAALALEGRVPVVPVGLWGTDHLSGFMALGKRPLIRVVIGEPFRFPSGLTREEALAVLQQRMADVLRKAQNSSQDKNI